MKPALDASRALTVALTAAQDDTIVALQNIAERCTETQADIRERFLALSRIIEDTEQSLTAQVRAVKDAALALSAEIRDGNADMARAMAEHFAKARPVAPLGEADAETKAIAVKLAPPAFYKPVSAPEEAAA